VTECKPTGTERRVIASKFTGTLNHLIYIERGFCLAPKGRPSANLLEEDAQKTPEERRYLINGEKWEMGFGMKPHPSKKKVVYSIKTKWTAGESLPWFTITHKLPKADVKEEKIINNRAEIDSLGKQSTANKKDIERDTKKYEQLTEDLNAIRKDKQDCEK
jgi:hypothetical protein